MRRSARSVAAVAVSLLAVIGVAASSGYMLWTAEFERLSLAGQLPPMPASIRDLAPVQAASAAPRAIGAPAGATLNVPTTPADPGATEARNARGGRRMRVPPPTMREADRPAPAMERADAGRRPASGASLEIRRRIRADHVAASLERAYGALRAGDAETAADAYRAVLEHEPRNRDAMLGIAAVAAHAGRWDEAAEHYAGILAFHPADAIAQAALIAIEPRNGERGESRLKTLLLSEPRAAYLHFTLGNIYAAQSRWPEARRWYRNAHHLDTSNADYAYNLAVSLDHLVRRASALDFYREALALARDGAASFETARVVARIRAIESSSGADATPARVAPRPAGGESIGRVR